MKLAEATRRFELLLLFLLFLLLLGFYIQRSAVSPAFDQIKYRGLSKKRFKIVSERLARVRARDSRFRRVTYFPRTRLAAYLNICICERTCRIFSSSSSTSVLAFSCSSLPLRWNPNILSGRGFTSIAIRAHNRPAARPTFETESAKIPVR